MPSMSRRTRAAAWMAAGVLGGLGVGAVVAQLGVASAADPSPAPVQPGDPGPGFDPGVGFGMAPGGKVLHGEATVKTPDGVREVATQNGKITAVDGATLSVRSSDDFTRDYAVDEDTRIALNGADGAVSSLQEGDTVHVMAVKDGGGWHAEAVLDGLPPHPMFGPHRDFAWHGRGGPPGRMMAPEPQPTATG